MEPVSSADTSVRTEEVSEEESTPAPDQENQEQESSTAEPEKTESVAENTATPEETVKENWLAEYGYNSNDGYIRSALRMCDSFLKKQKN